MEATRLLKEILISKRGELTPEAQAQIALRSDEQRGAKLERLVRNWPLGRSLQRCGGNGFWVENRRSVQGV